MLSRSDSLQTKRCNRACDEVHKNFSDQQLHSVWKQGSRGHVKSRSHQTRDEVGKNFSDQTVAQCLQTGNIYNPTTKEHHISFQICPLLRHCELTGEEISLLLFWDTKTEIWGERNIFWGVWSEVAAVSDTLLFLLLLLFLRRRKTK